VVLFFLGAFHGINPGMGWLFAVALGMQRQSGRAVWLSLFPIAAGHALAIGVVVAGAAMLGAVFPANYVKIFVACVLLGFGLYRLLRKGHPRWGGMQVGFRDLTIWSFLMASAHGAGFMLLPVVMGMLPGESHHQMHMESAAHGAWAGVWAVAVHTLGYLLVTGAIAFAVYKWIGLNPLRKAWVNLDIVWAVALIVTAVVALVW
jgi:threonine/homoserine/homoserine lactone efflux protein